MKLLTLAVGLVSVGELLSCLFLASFTTSYTSSLNNRVDLKQRNGFSRSTFSIDKMLMVENDRIAFIESKLHHVGEPNYEQMQSSTRAPLYSGQTIGNVNYIVQVGLGTPANTLFMAIDTGSDLAWTQCMPCDACYAQQSPIYNPTASSSYKQVLCADEQCAKLGSANSGDCSSTNSSKCDYHISYLDGSSTAGDFALEALTMDGQLASAAYPFGCGHNNQGLFQGMDGLLGLSRDTLSFPAQTKDVFGQNFAYCMPNIFSSSAGYVEFGAARSGAGEGGGGSTPLVLENVTTVYVVGLEAVQVEGPGASISTPASSMAMVVDSGTVITRLDRSLYEEVRDAFIAAAAAMNAGAQPGAGLGAFDTCYSESRHHSFPRITFTFTGGLAFTPSAQKSVIPLIDNGTIYICLALLPLDSILGVSILGNYHQQQHLFTFDLEQSTLGISFDEVC